VHAVKTPELLDRGLMVVDAQIDEDVGESRVPPVPLDERAADCWPRLPAPGPAAASSPTVARPAISVALEGRGEGVDGSLRRGCLRAGSHASAAARPLVAAGAGERRRGRRRVDNPERRSSRPSSASVSA
jgi:hypothetical protein